MKEVPEAPKNEVPVWLRSQQTFARSPFSQGTPWYPPNYDGVRDKESWGVRVSKSTKNFREWYNNWTPSTPQSSKSE